MLIVAKQTSVNLLTRRSFYTKTKDLFSAMIAILFLGIVASTVAQTCPSEADALLVFTGCAATVGSCIASSGGSAVLACPCYGSYLTCLSANTTLAACNGFADAQSLFAAACNDLQCGSVTCGGNVPTVPLTSTPVGVGGACSPDDSKAFALCGQNITACVSGKFSAALACPCYGDYLKCVAPSRFANCAGFSEISQSFLNACANLGCTSSTCASGSGGASIGCTSADASAFALCGTQVSACLSSNTTMGNLCACYGQYVTCSSSNPRFSSCAGFGTATASFTSACSMLGCPSCGPGAPNTVATVSLSTTATPASMGRCDAAVAATLGKCSIAATQCTAGDATKETACACFTTYGACLLSAPGVQDCVGFAPTHQAFVKACNTLQCSTCSELAAMATGMPPTAKEETTPTGARTPNDPTTATGSSAYSTNLAVAVALIVVGRHI